MVRNNSEQMTGFRMAAGAFVGILCTAFGIKIAVQLLAKIIEVISNGFDGPGTNGGQVLTGVIYLILLFFGFLAFVDACYAIGHLIAVGSPTGFLAKLKRDQSYYDAGMRPDGTLTSRQAEVAWERRMAQQHGAESGTSTEEPDEASDAGANAPRNPSFGNIEWKTFGDHNEN